MLKAPVPSAPELLHFSVPDVTKFGPVKLFAPERVSVLPPALDKPPAPLMLPLQFRA